MDLRQKTYRLMYDYRVTPKKRLGQNFMINDHFLELMASHAALAPSDAVLEVGAGFGFLTQHLAQKAGRVVAVEADPKLVGALQNQLADRNNVNIVEGNVLYAPIPPFNKVVSNPPFSISSPLLFWLLEKDFECAVLTFQEEFARRLAAQAGSEDYGRLTVSTYCKANVELLEKVPKEAFHPTPDVNAIIVRLSPRKSFPFWVKDKQVFYEVVRTLFSQRNRKVRKAIIPLLRKQGTADKEAAERADSLSFKERRVRDLSPENFGALANELSQ